MSDTSKSRGNERLSRATEPSVGGRLARVAWSITWFLLFRPTPRPFHRWRCLILRLFGAKVEMSAHPYPSVRIWAPWNLSMEAHSCLGDQVDCYCVDKVRIGAYATVSQKSFLCTASRDYMDPSMPVIAGPISIGERAWVAADVFIAPGVSVREGAVVLARSSVLKDVAPWTVAAGNPAKLVKTREIKDRDLDVRGQA